MSHQSEKKLSRRRFLGASALGGIALATTAAKPIIFDPTKPLSKSPFLKSGKFSEKVVILGMDGMDPSLVRQFVAEGHMPTFKKMMEKWHFGELKTTMPPHSPVAWASFITGTNPGGHGIFDFVHRDAQSFTPYMSTSRSFDASSKIDLGSWRIPLESGRVELMRKGVPYWSVLEQNGIPSVVCQIPSNFPIVPTSQKSISGMGTPDLLGTYGTFTYFTDGDYSGELNFAGGRVKKIRFKDHSLISTIPGPKNAFRTTDQDVEVEFKINRDFEKPVARIEIQGNTIVLKEGEWSSWTPIRFEMVPFFATAAGMVKFYLKKVHPHFELYVSPINVDPLEPGLPICSPPSYAKELAEAVGRFHTQGFPSDTKALSRGVLSDDEFLHHAKIVLEESFGLFEHQYNQFDEGAFFFYFSSVDQSSHMLWRNMDVNHPLYQPNASDEVKNALRYFYSRMDDALKIALSKIDSSTTLFALSDHGFSPFKREFNISTWLLEQGYTSMPDRKKQASSDFYQFVDWNQTKAYALGLNGIYINLAGREKYGRISKEEAPAIKQEIAKKLLEVRDPKDGTQVVVSVYDPKEIYSGPYADFAPDLVVGYQRGYRISDEAVLGKFPKDIVSDRTDKWAADHCMDHKTLAGMLLCSKEVKGNPGLWDMAPSILSLFGLEAPKEMTGRSVFRT